MFKDNKIPALWQTQNDSPTPRRKHFKLQCFYGATLRPKSQVTLSGLHQCIWIQASISETKVQCLGTNTTEIRKGKITGEPPFLHTSRASPSLQISLCNLADRSKAGQMLPPQTTESAKGPASPLEVQACRGAQRAWCTAHTSRPGSRGSLDTTWEIFWVCFLICQAKQSN